MSRPRTPLDPAKVERVRRYLSVATDAGFRLAAVLHRMKSAGFQIESRQDTVQKFKQRERDTLSEPNDLDEMLRFFTQHPTGIQMVGMISVGADNSATLSKPTAPEQLVYLAAAGTPKPENLTRGIRLASIAIEGSQWGLGSVFASVTVACGNWRGLTVERGRIVMECHPAMLTLECDNGWSEPRQVISTTFGGSKVLLVRGGSTRYDPFWDVAGIAGPVGKFMTDGSFAHVEGLLPGSEIVVTFGTWLGDIGDAPSGQELPKIEEVGAIDGLVILGADEIGRPIQEDARGYKRRLISEIRKAALGADSDSYVELSRCVLRAVERVTGDEN